MLFTFTVSSFFFFPLFNYVHKFFGTHDHPLQLFEKLGILITFGTRLTVQGSALTQHMFYSFRIVTTPSTN